MYFNGKNNPLKVQVQVGGKWIAHILQVFLTSWKMMSIFLSTITT